MCLTTKQRWPKIAWKPITTYKVVYSPFSCPGLLLTLYQNCLIRINNTYKETLGNIFKSREKDSITYIMHKGLHSYTEEDQAKLVADIYKRYNTIVIKCVIPKFSLYWIGEDNDIVSNKLKYVKVL